MKDSETARCPECSAVVRLTPEQADYDKVIVTCPSCQQQFTHLREGQ